MPDGMNFDGVFFRKKLFKETPVVLYFICNDLPLLLLDWKPISAPPELFSSPVKSLQKRNETYDNHDGKVGFFFPFLHNLL